MHETDCLLYIISADYQLQLQKWKITLTVPSKLSWIGVNGHFLTLEFIQFLPNSCLHSTDTLIIIIIFLDSGTQFPGNEKNYDMQYKKVQKLSWNELYSSSFTKLWCSKMALYYYYYYYTHLTALCPGLPGWASTRKVKPIWILLKQETVSGSGISWAICKSAPRSRQITMPTPHHSVFTGQMSFEHLTTEKNKTNDSVTQVNIEWLVIPVIQSISLVTF